MSLLLQRSITIYRRSDEAFQEEIELGTLSANELAVHFDIGEDANMVLAYPITSEQATFFEAKFGIKFDFQNYEYFLESSL